MPIYNVNASAPRLKGALGDLPSAAVLKLLHPPPPLRSSLHVCVCKAVFVGMLLFCMFSCQFEVAVLLY